MKSIDTLITEAIAVRALLQATLQRSVRSLLNEGLHWRELPRNSPRQNPRLAR